MSAFINRGKWLQVVFSLLVQSSEGATYGVVPFVSKRSLGVVSGFVGAGGNAGSVITQALFFKDSTYEVSIAFSFHYVSLDIFWEQGPPHFTKAVSK